MTDVMPIQDGLVIMLLNFSRQHHKIIGADTTPLPYEAFIRAIYSAMFMSHVTIAKSQPEEERYEVRVHFSEPTGHFIVTHQDLSKGEAIVEADDEASALILPTRGEDKVTA